jgi:hypothetical protein
MPSSQHTRPVASDSISFALNGEITAVRNIAPTKMVLNFRDCSESTGLPPEDVYRKVRVRTFEPGGQHDVRSR